MTLRSQAQHVPWAACAASSCTLKLEEIKEGLRIALSDPLKKNDFFPAVIKL